MSYMDEEIQKEKKRMQKEQQELESKRQQEQELEESIFDGRVTLLGKQVDFVREEIPELGISVLIPDNFILLSPELKSFIYPMGNEPSHAYGGEGMPYQLSFSKTRHQVPDEGMVKFIPQARKILERMTPKTKVLSADVIKHMQGEECYHIGIMEVVSSAIDMVLYNVMFYFSVDNTLFMGNICFPKKYGARMVKVAKETIDSLIIEKKEES